MSVMWSVRRGFTLLEMVIVIGIFSALIAVVFTAYSRMIHTKLDVEIRQTVIDRSYFLMEKLHVLLADYTIDYEEYYNRRMVGCDEAGVRGTWWENGYCDLFTWYGNGQNNGSSQPQHCSSTDHDESTVDNRNTNCVGTGRLWSVQSYGNYRQTFVDVKNDVDQISSVIGDEDDVDTWDGPVALWWETSEIAMISHDGTRRFYIRRALLGSGDWNGDGKKLSTDKLYGLQQLKLVWVDAGYDHSFAGSGAFDGKIDTWLCDAESGYMCSGNLPGSNAMHTAYHNKWYRFAMNSNEWWLDLLGKDITITDWGVGVYPAKDHDLARTDDSAQVSPSLTISMTTKIYGENWWHRLSSDSIESFSLPLQTTFAMKEFYR